MRRQRHQRPAVTWTDRSAPAPLAIKASLPYYQRPHEPTAEIREALAQGPGTLFVTKVGLYPQPEHGYPFAPLWPHYGPTPAPIKAGALVMYAGEIRAQEQKNGEVVQAIKHTFIAGGARYIINDWNQIKPA